MESKIDSLFNILADRRRLLSSSCKPRACRRLDFGPIDHDEINRTLNQEMEMIDQRNNEKWNFDFSNEQPLGGKYNWEKIENGDDNIPEAYKLPRVTLSISCKQVPLRKVYTLNSLRLRDNHSEEPLPESSSSSTSSLDLASSTMSSSCVQTESSSSDPLDDSIIRCESTPDVDPENTASTPNKRKRTQTVITDYLSQKKPFASSAKRRKLEF